MFIVPGWNEESRNLDQFLRLLEPVLSLSSSTDHHRRRNRVLARIGTRVRIKGSIHFGKSSFTDVTRRGTFETRSFFREIMRVHKRRRAAFVDPSKRAIKFHARVKGNCSDVKLRKFGKNSVSTSLWAFRFRERELLNSIDPPRLYVNFFLLIPWECRLR